EAEGRAARGRPSSAGADLVQVGVEDRMAGSAASTSRRSGPVRVRRTGPARTGFQGFGRVLGQAVVGP
ncbi:hypothetical protein, partial [Streptomyces griseus]|uniref:hypothetical protein n=1 Tax=Streptomyces griseus TaxID=1911 RepID=UPI001C404DE5